MITSIYNSFNSNNLVVSQMGGAPYVNPSYSTNNFSGSVRYQNNVLEVFDGGSWMPLSGSCSISLSHEANEAIEWAKKKKREEDQLDVLLEKYPALAETYSQFKMVKTLVEAEERNGNV